MRVSDFSSHLPSMGLGGFRPPRPVGAFLAVPIRHQREEVGNIYLAREPDDAAFTREDEETLALFASQAALVIANARTGAALSFNREAVRLMEAVPLPDRPPEDLLQVLTVRRFDGQAVSLADFPLAQVLSRGETVRAEEIVLSVPDGRSVTVLVNATPLRSEADNEVETVVVTLQDMTSLNELDKLRAEFLGMVSHELRAPLTSIRARSTPCWSPSTPWTPPRWCSSSASSSPRATGCAT